MSHSRSSGTGPGRCRRWRSLRGLSVAALALGVGAAAVGPQGVGPGAVRAADPGAPVPLTRQGEAATGAGLMVSPRAYPGPAYGQEFDQPGTAGAVGAAGAAGATGAAGRAGTAPGGGDGLPETAIGRAPGGATGRAPGEATGRAPEGATVSGGGAVGAWTDSTPPAATPGWSAGDGGGGAMPVSAPVGPSAEAYADARAALSGAEATLVRLTTTSGFKDALASLIQRARAVMIIPDFYKAGFILGAAYGNGVLLARQPDGRFSDPAFYRLTAGSIGFQAGIQTNEVIMCIMTDAGLKAVLEDQFKGGANASATFFLVGGGADASTTTDLGEDIYAFSHSVGLFGGAGLEGTAIEPRHDWNVALYGSGTTPDAILFQGRVGTPFAESLKHLLAGGR